MTDLIGRSLGRYHILEQLGEGGMAIVYKAYDTTLETDVAVKVVRTENVLPSVLERALKRFEREAKALARLTHPNIVSVTDYGEFKNKPYLVMKYLPGGTLKQKLGKPIPWQEVVRILLPITQALGYAHEQNMIHRDVKPSNILLTDKDQPMLSDFGVAKIFDLEETVDLTGTGMGVGTPEYMAPEQWTGGATAQSDIYALGIILYEMVTGRKPYKADTPAALLLKQANDPLPRPTNFVPNLPTGVERVLLKALAKDPKNRFQSMGEVAIALEKLVGTARATKPKEPLNWGFLRKRWASFSILGIGLLAAFIGIVIISNLLAKPTSRDNIEIQRNDILTKAARTIEANLIVSSSDEQKDTESAIPTDIKVPTQTQEVDSDDDGILDSKDSCPNQGDQGYGVNSQGCPNSPPDQDNDGIIDSNDSCPTTGNQGYGIDSTGCPIPAPEPDILSCPGSLETRVRIGMTIQVTTNQVNPVPKLGVRPQPDLDVHKEFEILSGERMLVLDGPICAYESYFWKISSSRGNGWIREGNTEFYFVDPVE